MAAEFESPTEAEGDAVSGATMLIVAAAICGCVDTGRCCQTGEDEVGTDQQRVECWGVQLEGKLLVHSSSCEPASL